MKRGFTLIEVLVVVSVVMVLLGLVGGSLSCARGTARWTVCASNVRQLAVAAGLYADDHGDRFAAGAPEFLANLTRWHGSRRSVGEAFEPGGGVLTAYLNPGATGDSFAGVRTCPEFARPAADLAEGGIGFERSSGGYAYNNAYAGVSRRKSSGERWVLVSDRVGSPRSWFVNPTGTVLFTDGALATGEGPTGVIEYGFAEARFWPHRPSQRPDPSVHFRHHTGRGTGVNGKGIASVAWLDGHVSGERMTFSAGSGLYEVEPGELGVGWFGTSDDNTLFAYR